MVQKMKKEMNYQWIVSILLLLVILFITQINGLPTQNSTKSVDSNNSNLYTTFIIKGEENSKLTSKEETLTAESVNTNRQHHYRPRSVRNRRRKHRHILKNNPAIDTVSSSLSLLSKKHYNYHHLKNRKHSKRCRYSEHEIALDFYGPNSTETREGYYDTDTYPYYKQFSDATNSETDKNAFNYYNEQNKKHLSKIDIDRGSFVKQPRVRDQNFNYNELPYGVHPSSLSSMQSSRVENEVILVDIGDQVNLTCYVNTNEIDWHFTDKNLTKTIISNGLQLQVPVLHYFEDNVYSSNNINDLMMMRRRSPHMANLPTKYKVSSDKRSIHMLTLFMQSAQDEGAYQCIDPKSENPTRKNIRIILSKHTVTV
jgi:hypothetical protein